jgi:hypothetical protein
MPCFRVHQTHKRVQRGTQESSLSFTGEILPKRKAPNKIVKNEVTLKPSIAKSERKKSTNCHIPIFGFSECTHQYRTLVKQNCISLLTFSQIRFG